MRLTKTQDFTNGLRGYSLRSPGADNSAEPAVVTWVRPSQAAIRSFAPLACISGWTGSGVRPLPPIDPLSFALLLSKTPIRGIHGIHGVHAIHGINTAAYFSFNFVFRHLQMAEVLGRGTRSGNKRAQR